MPLFVGEVLISDSIKEYSEVDFDSYSRMIEVWKSKQIFYEDKFNERNDISIDLDALLEEKNQLEININNLNHEEKIMKYRYASYEEEFKQIVFFSDKSRVLESYEIYQECRRKIEESVNSNEPYGEPSIIEAWVEQASRKINESNMAQAEIKILEEAKSSPFFDKEYSVFAEIEQKLEEIGNDLHNNKKILKEKEEILNSMTLKLDKLNEYLEVLKEIYPDIE